MKWKQPPVIKFYEALGAVADGRLVIDGNTAKCYSSSGNKYYVVDYDFEQNAIMTNDNGSYWKGYLGYPAIAFLLQKGVLTHKPERAELLKGVAWKDINTKFKNDFDETLTHILEGVSQDVQQELAEYVAQLVQELREQNLSLLGKKTKPPEGY